MCVFLPSRFSLAQSVPHGTLSECALILWGSWDVPSRSYRTFLLICLIFLPSACCLSFIIACWIFLNKLLRTHYIALFKELLNHDKKY